MHFLLISYARRNVNFRTAPGDAHKAIGGGATPPITEPVDRTL